jgi:hypothetical protein
MHSPLSFGGKKKGVGQMREMSKINERKEKMRKNVTG